MKASIKTVSGFFQFDSETPTKSGPYWWARFDYCEPELVKVGYMFDDDRLDCQGSFGVISVHLRGGLWCGPLHP